MSPEQREARVVELRELINDIFEACDKSHLGKIYWDAPVTPQTPMGKSLNQVSFTAFNTLLANMCPKSPSKVIGDTSLNMTHMECGE